MTDAAQLARRFTRASALFVRLRRGSTARAVRDARTKTDLELIGWFADSNREEEAAFRIASALESTARRALYDHARGCLTFATTERRVTAFEHQLHRIRIAFGVEPVATLASALAFTAPPRDAG